MPNYGEPEKGGAATYWSPERHVRRRQASADGGYKGTYDLGGEGEDGDVQENGALTLDAWVCSEETEVVGGDGDRARRRRQCRRRRRRRR